MRQQHEKLHQCLSQREIPEQQQKSKIMDNEHLMHFIIFPVDETEYDREDVCSGTSKAM